MAFALTTNDFALQEDTFLVARIQKGKNTWLYSQIDLNIHIGSYNGEFDVTSSGWFAWSRPGSSHLRGTVLFAQLMRLDGSWGPMTSIDLNLFIKNDNGILKFMKIHESITTSTSCLNLNNSILQGLCFGYDGRIHYSEINLDDHHGNNEGRIECANNPLFKGGEGFRLSTSPSEIRLYGHLRCHPRWRPKSRRRTRHISWNRGDINLANCIINRDGQFEFMSTAELSRNYQPAPSRCLEDVPQVGYIAGGVDLISGNEERIAQAINNHTSSSIAAIGILVGATVGTILENAMVGLTIGTGLASPGGISPEIENLTTCISDPLILARLLEASIGRYVFRALRNMLSPSATGYLVAFMRSSLESKVDIDTVANDVLNHLGAGNISRGGGISIENAITRAVDALCGKRIPEWSDLDLALQMIRSQQIDHFNDTSSYAFLLEDLSGTNFETCR